MFYEQNFRIRADKWVLGLKVSRGGNNSLFHELLTINLCK